MINGALGVVSYLGDVLDQVLSLHIEGDRIAAIYIVRNPHKLAHLRG
jgi:RNA polymerase sigma-70 factor (ECF subfamily)